MKRFRLSAGFFSFPFSQGFKTDTVITHFTLIHLRLKNPHPVKAE
jgi:hypothetical protein